MQRVRRVLEFVRTSTTPLDYLHRKDRGKLNIGWCSFFPPSQHGVAAATYTHANALNRMKGVQVYAIPADGRIDKKLFPGVKIARVGDKELDAVIFFCLAFDAKKFVEKCNACVFIWQTVHESPEKDLLEKKLFEKLEGIENIILVTNWAAREYARSDKKAKYIPIGVDTKKFRPEKKKEFEVLFVSRIHHFKGIIPFLNAIPLVLRKNQSVKFRLHAPIDIYSPYLEEILAEIRITAEKFPENFVFEDSWEGYEKMSEKYRKASVLVFPSSSEGFGVPMIEAMSCGIPCIVADKKPMNEIVEEGKTGFCLKQRQEIHGCLFPGGKEIAEKINYLIENKKAYGLLCKNARKKAEREYDLKKVLGEIAKEIKKSAKK